MNQLKKERNRIITKNEDNITTYSKSSLVQSNNLTIKKLVRSHTLETIIPINFIASIEGRNNYLSRQLDQILPYYSSKKLSKHLSLPSIDEAKLKHWGRNHMPMLTNQICKRNRTDDKTINGLESFNNYRTSIYKNVNINKNSKSMLMRLIIKSKKLIKKYVDKEQALIKENKSLRNELDLLYSQLNK